MDFLRTQIFGLEVLVVEAVEQEVQQIRHDSLSTFGFQKFYQMVVGSREEFYQDLANDADTSVSSHPASRQLSKSWMISRQSLLKLAWIG